LSSILPFGLRKRVYKRFLNAKSVLFLPTECFFGRFRFK
jgi:hypothetical protein